MLADVVACAMEVKGETNEYRWQQMVQTSLHEVGLVDEFASLRVVSNDERGKGVAMDEWKGRVKVAVRERGERVWVNELCIKRQGCRVFISEAATG